MSQLIGDSLDKSVDELVVMLSSQEMPSSPNRRPQVTKVITVPTSEHVAQIVGKSGSKIKNLRAATQTCIKTPLRGDDPVFTVSGAEVNVDKVIDVIKQASDHFTRLMESRSSACAVGEVTINVAVPQQYVGVVVGRNGSVIMRIKEQTRTRINTPKGDVPSPNFEVTGTLMNVMAAKEAIEDKVRQALMLKASTAFDPDLSHKTQSLSETIDWPQRLSVPSLPSIPGPSSSSGSGGGSGGQLQTLNANINHNQNKSVFGNTGWSTSTSLFDNQSLSPHFVNQFFAGNPLSPPILDSNLCSFRF